MSFGNETNYEKIAESYIDGIDERPFTAFYERPFIINQLQNINNKNILDLGCASGFYSEYCLKNGADVVAVDASKKMIEYTKKRCNSNINLRTYVHDIADPFDFLADGEFDIIVCSLVMHYLEDWAKTLNEFYRILKPNGFCYVSTHHPINDFTHFNKKNYFSKRLIEDEWKTNQGPISVKYFVRPLTQYIQPMLKCRLTLKEIVEPEPIKELMETDSIMYNRLKKYPAFLFYILQKEK